MTAAQQRLAQVREGCLDEFAADAEEYVSEVELAAQALAEPLRLYLEAWAVAEAKWKRLRPAIVSHRQQADLDRPIPAIRDESQLYREAVCQPCPVSAEIAERVRSLAPRPLAMDPSYDPFAPAPTAVNEPMSGPDGVFLFGPDPS